MLWCLDWLSWQLTFLLLAALVFINTLPILLFKEPSHTSHSPHQYSQPSLVTKIKAYLGYFLKIRNFVLG